MQHSFSLLSLMGFSILSIFGCKPPCQNTGTETPDEKLAAYASYPDALYPIRLKGKWGYMNRKGDIVIDPTFAEADDFEEGLAVVMMTKGNESGYGYIDTSGAWRIQPIYSRANKMRDGLAVVAKGDLYGYVDNTGKEIISCQFEQAGPFSAGRAAVKKNGWVGFINDLGNMVIEPKFTCSVDHPFFVNGIAPVFGADEVTGYIDTAGNWKIEPKFHSASKFSEGLAWAMTKEDDANAQYGFRIRGGYIDTTGEYVIQPQYDFGWDFFEGYATVWKLSDDRRTRYWYIIDKQGNQVLKDLTYRNMGAITEGLIPVQNEDMEWGFINLKGEEIIKPKYTGINRFKNGLARMETGSAFDPKPVFINTKGEIVWKE